MSCFILCAFGICITSHFNNSFAYILAPALHLFLHRYYIQCSICVTFILARAIRSVYYVFLETVISFIFMTFIFYFDGSSCRGEMQRLVVEISFSLQRFQDFVNTLILSKQGLILS